MLRLKLMPLAPDFGESLEYPFGVLCPKTQLVFTRDYRIFEQLPHFLDRDPENSQPAHIQVSALPPNLQVIELSEEEEGKQTREDETGLEFVVALVEQLKTLVMPDDTSATNKAVKAYIDQLPDETPVIMGWI